ncbi:hypothetical protein GF314_14150 [bacterium]|nr:hypothetical protein [bacterium]
MRRSLVLVVLALLVSGSAIAQDTMHVSFDPEFLDPFIVVPEETPFTMYVAIDASTAFIGGYECSLIVDQTRMIVLTATGPNGWTNFGGSNLNHLVGFQTPVPAGTDYTVVGEVEALVLDPHLQVADLGAAEPSSFDPPSPGYADGIDPDNLIACTGFGGTINGGLATEGRSLSQVKALFD